MAEGQQGKLPETKCSLGGPPGSRRGGWGEGMRQRATLGWRKAHSVLMSVAWGLGSMLLQWLESGQGHGQSDRKEGEEGGPPGKAYRYSTLN